MCNYRGILVKLSGSRPQYLWWEFDPEISDIDNECFVLELIIGYFGELPSGFLGYSWIYPLSNDIHDKFTNNIRNANIQHLVTEFEGNYDEW